MSIQNNTNLLNSLLEQANNLPDASIETHVEEKDVNFYDYDGTLLYSYTLEEAQELTELPPGTDWHDGLVFDGWNWTLTDLQEYAKPMDVGAHYITDDGKTRLYLHLASEHHLSVPLCFSQSQAHGVTIDWGDGSTVETNATRWGCTVTHEYPKAGDYVITLTVTNGYVGLGLAYHYYSVIGGSSNSEGGYKNIRYKGSLTKVEIGRGVNEISSRSFYYCINLKSVTVPSGVPLAGNYNFAECHSLEFLTCQTAQSANAAVFIGCYRLKRVSLSKNAYFGDNFFNYCYSLAKVRICHAADGTGFGAYAFDSNNGGLKEIEIPSTQTVIKECTFRKSESLIVVTIPSGVTSIAANAFGTCPSLGEVHLLSTTPPTLANVNAFSGVPNDCIFFVPANSLEAYQTATNWTTYASQMVGV